MTTYSVNEVFKRLKALKITSNEESVRKGGYVLES